jgi:hypothetical protein
LPLYPDMPDGAVDEVTSAFGRVVNAV